MLRKSVVFEKTLHPYNLHENYGENNFKIHFNRVKCLTEIFVFDEHIRKLKCDVLQLNKSG